LNLREGKSKGEIKVINLYINQRREGEVTILDLKGRVNIGGGSLALHKSILSLVQEGKTRILLSLAEVAHIDSCGFGELVSSHITVTNKGGSMKLVHINEPLRESMVVTRILPVFDVFDDEQEALASFDTEVKRIVRTAAL
jgi:anti-sigma B factor antagonist